MGEARIRVIHASFDAPAVDVFVDGQRAISGLAFGASSGFLTVEAGDRRLQVFPSSGGDAVIDTIATLEDGQDYTIYAVNQVASIEALVSLDARSPTEGMAKVRFLHSSPDAPAVDIKIGSADGAVVFSDVSFKDIADYIEVAPGTYTFVVTPAGQDTAVVTLEPATLEASQTYTILAVGTLDPNDAYAFKARVFVDTGDGKTGLDLDPEPFQANVRVIHASYDAPEVDILLDGNVAITELAYGLSSGYAQVEADTHDVQVVPSAGGSPVIQADLTLERDKDYTVLATGPLSSIGPVVTVDEREPAADKARLRFIHASPDAPAVDIKAGSGTGPAVFENAAFQDVTGYIELDAGDYTLAVTAAGDTTEVIKFQPAELEAGRVYTAIALGTLAGTDMVPFIVRVFIDNDAGQAFIDLTPE